MVATRRHPWINVWEGPQRDAEPAAGGPGAGVPAVAIGLFGAVAAAIGEVLVKVARQGARFSRLGRRRE